MFAEDREAGMRTLLEGPPVREAVFFDGSPIHLVTGHAEIRDLLTDPRVSNDFHKQQRIDVAATIGIPEDLRPYLRHNLSQIDAPEHTRLRRLALGEFTSRRVGRLRPRIQEISDGLLDTLADRADLRGEFAYPLPVMVICEIVGVPSKDRERWRGWSAEMTVPDVTVFAKAARSLIGYVRELIAAKRADPVDDLLSGLIKAGLSEEELSSLTVSLLRAGHETTANLIANGVGLLLAEPGRWAALAAAPELVPSTVEEFLRFSGVADFGVVRYTTEPVEIAGVRIGAGEAVMPVYYAGNRDAGMFSDPDRLCPERTDNPHLGFGHGAHHCLGAPLARLEVQTALTALLARFPGMTLDGEPPRWAPGAARTLPELRVRLR
ncbi:cytochrome P450 [Streptosporangium sp. NPDC002721]|uniref:cytochrome P450 family protein n=1 Tax=Streptosporangium sp. NPDC002721 TaxID=3366188 RepID=UPI0036A80CB4